VIPVRAVAAAVLLSAAAAVAEEERPLFVDPDDGWFDVTGFLSTRYGFVPVIAPITEPAVGYGAAGALVFVDRDRNAPPSARPDLYAAGGMLTESSSWGTLGGYAGTWLGGDLRTLAGAGYVSLNLQHYGIGEDSALSQNPVAFNLRAAVAGASAAMRIPSTALFAGLGMGFAKARVELHGNLPSATDSEATFLALRPLLQLDTRDNVFTPTRGLFGEAAVSFVHEGNGTWFELLDLTAIGYLPLSSDLYLGARGGAGFSFGDAPFYLRPYVVLRGAPAMRYQGEQTGELEAELRWQFWKRFSLVGFGGVGGAWTSFLDFDRSEAVFTYGAGFRYELARGLGLHMGADFAFGANGFVLYIQFGSAWFHL